MISGNCPHCGGRPYWCIFVQAYLCRACGRSLSSRPPRAEELVDVMGPKRHPSYPDIAKRRSA